MSLKPPQCILKQFNFQNPAETFINFRLKSIQNLNVQFKASFMANILYNVLLTKFILLK